MPFQLLLFMASWARAHIRANPIHVLVFVPFQVFSTSLNESINSLDGGMITSSMPELIMQTFSGKVCGFASSASKLAHCQQSVCPWIGRLCIREQYDWAHIATQIHLGRMFLRCAHLHFVTFPHYKVCTCHGRHAAQERCISFFFCILVAASCVPPIYYLSTMCF